MDECSERECETRKSMHTAQCMPRLWRKSTTAVATQASLLERFRETVLKLIMISAVSNKGGGGGGGGRTRGERAAGGGGSGWQQHVRHLHPDSYQREAVEECIEFFKRSAGAEGGERASSVREEAQDLEVGFASLQVM